MNTSNFCFVCGRAKARKHLPSKRYTKAVWYVCDYFRSGVDCTTVPQPRIEVAAGRQ